MKDFVYHGGDGHPLHAVSIGQGPALVLLHGGGPDHRSLLPLASRFADHRVVLPDIRGYGRSVCADPTRHTWARYADDVIALIDHLGIDRPVLGGTGLGGTITLRTAMARPDRVRAAVVISVEDIEDDDDKPAETELFDEFARRIHSDGLAAAWEPLLDMLTPLIGNLVREAIGRTDPASAAAAAAIGHDRAFTSVDDLAGMTTPTLVIPGADARHPTSLAGELAAVLPRGVLAPTALSADLRTAEDLARTVAPAIRAFLDDLPG